MAATSEQLKLSNRAFTLADPSFDLWPTALCAELVQMLNIATACVFYIRPIISSLELGALRYDRLPQRRVEGRFRLVYDVSVAALGSRIRSTTDHGYELQ